MQGVVQKHIDIDIDKNIDMISICRELVPGPPELPKSVDIMA